MKKILSVLALLFVGFVLVACNPTVEEDGALAKLENAKSGMDILINDPSNITTNFVVPAQLAGGIVAEWSSDNPGVISFGTAQNNEVTATVNRPAKGQGDATVKITATLKLQSEISDEMLEVEWEKSLTVKENTVEEIDINSIADILAITDESYDGGTYSVDIPSVTIFAEGDVYFGYDGTGIIQLFNSQTTFEVGKVYDVTGALEWYFGIWELVGSTGTLKSDATPQYPEKESVESIDDKIAALTETDQHNFPNVADGNFEPIYATIKGNIFMIDGDTGNYNTYIIDVSKDDLVLGTPSNPASGFMFYYGTQDFSYVRSYEGFEVEMDVVIYTYRSNNLAFAVYYVGGPEGITANLNEDQKVEVAKESLSLSNQVYKEDQTLNLIETSSDVAITWSFKDSENTNNALIDLTDGSVALPAEGQVDVVLVATLTVGEASDTKEFTIRIGEVPLSTVAEVIAAESNTYKFRIIGTVLGFNGNRQISIADETGAITVYHSVSGAEALAALIGKEVEIIGSRTAFGGLLQLGSPEVTDLETDGTMPIAKDLSEVEVWDAESLLPFQANLISVFNLRVTAVGTNDYGNVELELYDETSANTIKFFWDSRQPLVGSSDFITGLEVGDYVSFENALLSWRSNNPVIGIHDAAQATEGESPILTDAQELALDKLSLELPVNVTETLELPATLANGTTVIWSSSLPAVIGNDGVFIQPESDTEVTITAALTNGDETDTKIFVVTAKAPVSESVLAYTIDFGSEAKLGYAAGDLTFTNGDDTLYVLNKDRTQINTSVHAPHNDGHFLVMSIRDTAKEAFVEFDFTEEAGLSKISFEMNVWNNTLLDTVKDLPNSVIKLQVLVGEAWVDVESTNELTNVISMLSLEEYVEVSFLVDGPGMYRIFYAGDAVATGNTTTAITVDNVKVFVSEAA